MSRHINTFLLTETESRNISGNPRIFVMRLIIIPSEFYIYCYNTFCVMTWSLNSLDRTSLEYSDDERQSRNSNQPLSSQLKYSINRSVKQVIGHLSLVFRIKKKLNN